MKKTAIVVIALMIAVIVTGCSTNSTNSENGLETSEDYSQIMDNASVSYLGPAGTYTEEAA